MNTGLLTRRRRVSDREVREPTLLAFALTVTGIAVLLGACAVGIVSLPAFGHVWWTFAAVAVILLGLARGRRRRTVPGPPPPTGRQRGFHLLLGLGRLLLLGVLAGWLALIAWSALCPGGPDPPAKADPALIRVVTWNIHCGQGEGPPWQRFDWPARRHALRAALDRAGPDILCVQEATPGQVAFLEGALPGHRRVGVGRDGPEAGGEHRAIFFDRRRFEEVGGDTFWLEEPTDRPRAGSALGVKRICTWVRLRDRAGGRTVRAYNAHLYLTEAPRLAAARLILAHVAAGERADAVLLTADFNAPPSAPSRRLFTEAGLADSAARAGKPAGVPTFQLYGIGLRCLDGILVDAHWVVRDHLVLRVKPGNTFPSDHFGLLADLALPE
jgi:endonuclease/exonuclease/phosphatase family metal-dependent hydrolase